MVGLMRVAFKSVLSPILTVRKYCDLHSIEFVHIPLEGMNFAAAYGAQRGRCEQRIWRDSPYATRGSRKGNNDERNAQYRLCEVQNGNHLESFVVPFPQLVVIQPHAQKAFDLLVDHVESNSPLPPSQCVPKGGTISQRLALHTWVIAQTCSYLKQTGRTTRGRGRETPPLFLKLILGSPVRADLSLQRVVPCEPRLPRNETGPLRLTTGRISMTPIGLCPYRSRAAFWEYP
jgi:hypothetical protein